MAEPRKEEGHMGLALRPGAELPLWRWVEADLHYASRRFAIADVATASAGEQEGSHESAAGMSVIDMWRRARPFSIYMPEINDAMDRARGNNPRPEAKENAAPISEELFAKAMKKLSNVVRKSYDESTQVPTIYKVPDELKGGVGDHKNYRPVTVYLGGFFSTKYERRKLEEYKWCCVWQLIDQMHGHAVDSVKARGVLRLCMESMNHLLPEVLASYSQDIVHNDEMAEQMLLDGCFILRRLLKDAPSAAERRKDDADWTQTLGHYGMQLLENQIPFCVVKKLFELLKIEDESEELLFTGSLKLFRSMSLQMHELADIERDNVHHLLHLFYLSVGFPYESKPHLHEDVSLQWVPSAKELEEAGVRFRKKRKATSFLDISFDNRRGILEIPPLEPYDSSSALFRNLIAFEQTYQATMFDISAYIAFMNFLVNTPEDMRILSLRGILVNNMNGEQDTSRFFSQLCVEVCIPRNNYLADLMQEVNKYKDSRRHKWREALVRNYFSNPWRAMSVFAAVLLLSLTILQTFFTIYPYYKASQHA